MVFAKMDATIAAPQSQVQREVVAKPVLESDLETQKINIKIAGSRLVKASKNRHGAPKLYHLKNISLSANCVELPVAGSGNLILTKVQLFETPEQTLRAMSEIMTQAPAERPVVLCILDGWGLRNETEDNAVTLGATPNWDRMTREWPMAQLVCSGEDVGLPEGQMGNSEVGHLNLGAGRIVWQDLPRINRAIADGSLANEAALTDYIDKLKAMGGTCHLLGLVSPGGVHAHQDHIAALAKILADHSVPTRIHAFTDGRDTPPESAVEYVRVFEEAIANLENVSIATVCGRFYAMDRDNRWDRVEQAYNIIVSGDGSTFEGSVSSAVAAANAGGTTDEFILPVRASNYSGIQAGDGILYANFRADRVRELLAALIDPAFDGFDRKQTVLPAATLGMVAYSEHLDTLCPAIFPPQPIPNTLGEVVAAAGRRQLRAAETEKYPHVTYFFNGGDETPNDREDRLLVPSPKVATYDLQPEMSAPELTGKLLNAIAGNEYDLFVINYANGDMVGHTGDLEAAKKATECVDNCIGRLEEAVRAVNGTMIVIADHGNCEQMFDREAGVPHTAHTLNPVPFILINSRREGARIANGRLADVSPTILDLMGLPQPEEMTGRSLIEV